MKTNDLTFYGAICERNLSMLHFCLNAGYVDRAILNTGLPQFSELTPEEVEYLKEKVNFQDYAEIEYLTPLQLYFFSKFSFDEVSEFEISMIKLFIAYGVNENLIHSMHRLSVLQPGLIEQINVAICQVFSPEDELVRELKNIRLGM